MSQVLFSPPAEVLTEAEKRARTLEAAALEGEVRGWTHSVFEAEDGRVCLVGAINKAQDYESYDRYNNAAAVWGGHWSDMPTLAGQHDARVSYPELFDPYDPAFLLRWRASEIRDGWDH